MRWTWVVFLVGLAAVVGCVRSDLTSTQHIDCTTGELVVVANAPFCVYEQLPEECPEALPYPLTDGEVFFCTIEPHPPGEVVAAARSIYEQAPISEAGSGPEAGTTLDAGLEPPDVGAADGGIIDFF